MMWIVRLALRRPYTFVVFAFLILILGIFSIETTPVDIFPNIDIPVVTVVWQFAGLSPDQIANRIIFNAERGLTVTVNDIDHIESQSLVGVGVIKVYFKPHIDIGSAVAQVVSISQVELRSMPAGTLPPFIIQYNASSVPILQLGLSGRGLNEQQLNDLGTNTIRTQMADIEGAQMPYPYGGKVAGDHGGPGYGRAAGQGTVARRRHQCRGCAKHHRAVGHHQDQPFEYQVETNSAPTVLNELNDLPIKAVNGAVIYIRDVAHVRDGSPPQTNIVRVDGHRAVLMNILKVGHGVHSGHHQGRARAS